MPVILRDMPRDEARKIFDAWLDGEPLDVRENGAWRPKTNEWLNKFQCHRIAPAKPLTVAWEHIPAGYDWVAADECGDVAAHRQRPIASKAGFWRADFIEREIEAGSIDLTPLTTLYNRGTVPWVSAIAVRPGT